MYFNNTERITYCVHIRNTTLLHTLINNILIVVKERAMKHLFEVMTACTSDQDEISSAVAVCQTDLGTVEEGVQIL